MQLIELRLRCIKLVVMTMLYVLALSLPLNKVVFGQSEDQSENIVGEKIELPSKKVIMPKLLAKRLLKEMLADGYELPEELKNDYKKGVLNFVKFFSSEAIDLNKDGRVELVVRQSESNGICRGHNCPIWVFSSNKNKNKNQLLLKALIGSYDLVLLKNKNRNYQDLLLVNHSSVNEKELKIYQYASNKYEIKKCVTEIVVENKEKDFSYQYKEHSCN